MIRERKLILILAKECEKSAHQRLRSLNNPPDTKLTYIMEPVAGECYRALKYVKQIRRAIHEGKPSTAGLAAFRLGQTALRVYMRPFARDADRGRKVIDASRAGAARSKIALSIDSATVKLIVEQFKIMRAKNPSITMARASQILSSSLNAKPRTIRKYLARFQSTE